VAILWIATQTDVLVVASSAAGDQVKGVVFEAGRAILTTVFGDQLFTIIQHTGSVGIVAALLGLAAATGASIAGLSALATASSRRRA
jgi:hypothetical protein